MEYLTTVLATFTVYHLLVGGLLYLILLGAFRWLPLSAEMQNWLWLTAFVIACMLPFGLFFQNEPTASITNLSQPASEFPIDIEPVVDLPIANQPLATSVASINTNQKVNLSFPTQWTYWLTPWFVFGLCIWGVGCIWRMQNIVQSMRKTQQLINESCPYTVSDRLDAMQCEVRMSSTIHSPLVVGLFKPIIVLPLDLMERLSAEQLRPIILHEWAHIQRKDLWTVIVQEAVAIVFWWSPVMRLFNRKIYITRELACDMRAARDLANPKQYAQCLLECARLMITRRHDVLAMGMFRKKQDLNQRVDHVMKMEYGRVHSSLISIVACSALVFTGIVLAIELDQKFVIAKQDNNHYLKVASVDDDQVLIDADAATVEKLKLEKANMLREKQARRWDNQDSVSNVEIIGEAEIREHIREMQINNSPLTIESLVCEADLCELEVKSTEESGFAQQVSSLLRGLDRKYRTSVSVSYLSTAELTAKVLIPIRYWPSAKKILTSDDMHALDQLIENGFDINARMVGDGTPLIIAVRAQNQSMVEYLIRLGADVNLAAPRDGNPLIAAAKTGNTELVELLYQFGADINAVVKYDETPLINASRFGQFEMVKFLVEHGADVNLGVDAIVRGSETEYRSPLNQAANPKIREFLIQAGAQS